MTNEEKYIRSRMGTENHFRVPEGYFDQLTANVMSRVSAEPAQPMKPVARRRPMLRIVRPLLYAASILLLAVLTITLYPDGNDNVGQQLAVATPAETVSDTYFDDVADYAMVDNAEIYAYLASE